MAKRLDLSFHHFGLFLLSRPRLRIVRQERKEPRLAAHCGSRIGMRGQAGDRSDRPLGHSESLDDTHSAPDRH